VSEEKECIVRKTVYQGHKPCCREREIEGIDKKNQPNLLGVWGPGESKRRCEKPTNKWEGVKGGKILASRRANGTDIIYQVAAIVKGKDCMTS